MLHRALVLGALLPGALCSCSARAVLGAFDATISVEAGPPADDTLHRQDDAGYCPAVCNGGCAGGVCTILDTKLDPGTSSVSCPEDWSCDVQCSHYLKCPSTIVCGARTCAVHCPSDACYQKKIDCGNASRCDIQCSGMYSCEQTQVSCGTSACSVTCEKQLACEKDVIDCSKAASCQVSCKPDDACYNNTVLRPSS